MRLSRRDALAALAATGVAVGGGAVALQTLDEGGDEEREDGPLTSEQLRTLVAAGEVLYPAAVDGVGTFVTSYANGVAEDRPDHADGMADALDYLEEYARSWEDDSFAALSPSARDGLLREMGADSVAAVPDGDDAERVRYYVVEELLVALYSTPTGGDLIGIENPPGHPGGQGSYQRGPRP